METVLITGGAGFFGSLLKNDLLRRGYRCVSIDLETDTDSHPNLRSIKGDIRNLDTLREICRSESVSVIMHCAAILAHAVKDRSFLWTSNVDGTKNIARVAKEFSVPKVIFTSSNCLWGNPFDRPVREDDAPHPVEIYGQSKWEGEKILLEAAERGEFDAVVFRCPTIIDTGRLGLLSILFAFIDEGRKVWVVGGGENVYQFVYAQDLIDACVRAMAFKGTDLFNVGSDDVRSFRVVYESVIERAHTKARVANFPKSIAIPLMKLAYALRLSPLGPYQYKMIAESFVFDTTKIKTKLGWKPTLSNEQMLWKAYEYYHLHRSEIENRTDVSAHKQAAKMGVIRILKWFS